MTRRRLDAGAMVAALGAVLLIVSLFLDWYGDGDDGVTAEVARGAVQGLDVEDVEGGLRVKAGHADCGPGHLGVAPAEAGRRLHRDLLGIQPGEKHLEHDRARGKRVHADRLRVGEVAV